MEGLYPNDRWAGVKLAYRQFNVVWAADVVIPVVPYNPLRIYLAFTDPVGISSVFVATSGLTATSIVGIFVPPEGIVEFKWSDVGPLVQSQWDAQDVGLASEMTVFETTIIPATQIDSGSNIDRLRERRLRRDMQRIQNRIANLKRQRGDTSHVS